MVIPSHPGTGDHSLHNDEPPPKARGTDFCQAPLLIYLREFGDRLQVMLPQSRPVPHRERAAPYAIEKPVPQRSAANYWANLLREVGSGSRRVVESALEKAGLKLKSFKKVMELDSSEAIKSAAEVGLGVGFVSRWALGKELEFGLLKVTEVEGIRVTRHFTLISRTGPEPQGLVHVFRAFTLKRAAHISKIRTKSNPTT